jgi:hypothetical protein
MDNLLSVRSGRLTVISFYDKERNGHKRYLCKCDCGNYTVVRDTRIRNHETKSCGCISKEHLIEYNTKHGLSNSPLYIIYQGMMSRCYNPDLDGYHRYGGRGIKVCDEWLSDIENFIKWGKESGFKKGLTLDRIDNDGDYEPNNCRWVTSKIQSRNTVRNNRYSIENETRTLIEWCELHSINYRTVKSRLSRGWSFEDAMTREVETKYRRK